MPFSLSKMGIIIFASGGGGGGGGGYKTALVKRLGIAGQWRQYRNAGSFRDRNFRVFVLCNIATKYKTSHKQFSNFSIQKKRKLWAVEKYRYGIDFTRCDKQRF